MSTTTLTDVRDGIAAQIRRIIPRHAASRSMRWRWAGDRNVANKVAGPSRTFDLLPALPIEVPGGGYGDGLQYAAEVAIRVTYDRMTDIDATLLGADDIADLSAMLVAVHIGIPGMLPIETEGSRSDPLLRAVIDPDSKESRRVVDLFFTVHYYAADTVSLE